MKKILAFLFVSIFQISFSQEIKSLDSLQTEKDIAADIESIHQNAASIRYSPRKAGWRSAVIPGWGQYYNRKYWKIPIVWGAIGTGIGFIIWNQKQYKRYKNAFEAELNGQPHEFSGITGVDLKTALGNTQDSRRRYRDYAIAITAAVYLLNIVDAVVDAHLYEGRKDPDLALSPTILNDYSGMDYSVKAGLSLSYKF